MSSEERGVHRRGWIDYARGFVIIYVVYRHAMTGLLNAGIPINNLVYLVQESSMPVFFIVSGIFIQNSAQKRGFGNFVKFKLDSLIYPYLIWASIHLVLQILFNDYANSNKGFYYFQYIFTYPRAIDQFWYLYSLFFVMILFTAVNFFFLKYNPLKNVILAVILYLLSFYVSTDWFSLNDIIFYYSFLVFGFLMADKILPVGNDFFKGKWLIIAIPIYIALYYLWNLNYTGINRLDDLDFNGFILFMPITIISALFLFFIASKLDQFNSLKFIRYIGSHSLYIYIMHLIFTGATRGVLIRFFPELNPVIMLTLLILAGVFIPILLYQLFMKLNMNFLFDPSQIRALVSNSAHKSR